jgi:formylglycine-generating enzyme required for sulfatase activity
MQWLKYYKNKIYNISLSMPQKTVKKYLKLRDRILIIIFVTVLGTVAVRALDKKFAQTNPGNEPGKCPVDMVLVTSGEKNFCLDKFEETANSKCPYINPDNQSQTMINLNDQDCAPETIAGKSPWRFISQDQATLACAKQGKRLPTNDEWYASALGTPDKNSQWGNDDCQVDNNWPVHPGLTGSGKNCISSAGAYDMVGNVWEWVKDTIEEGQYKNNKLPDSGYVNSMNDSGLPAITDPNKTNQNYNNDYFWVQKSGVRAIARGGYWNNKSDAGAYSAYIYVQPSSAETGIGFRCAKNLY